MGILTWLFGGDPAARAAKLEKRATAVKKEKPDEAMAALRQAEALQKQAGAHLYTQLQTRLRMATVMYENGKFDDAERFLLLELETARRLQLEKRADGPADFDRNLYCKAIYTKLRTCYELAKRFDKALVFAMAQVYAEYENSLHIDLERQPDFKPVLRCLKKLGREDDMERLQAVFGKYARKPDSTKCWRMIDEIQENFTK